MNILVKFWGYGHENDRKNNSLLVTHSINKSIDVDYSINKVVTSTSHEKK